MAHKLDLNGKTVFITGGSSGLGLEIAKAVGAQGANVSVFARRQEVLDKARSTIEDIRVNQNQEFNAISVDLSDASEVDFVFRAQKRQPDILICSAGGTPSQAGFINDIGPEQIVTCMQNNYLTAAFCAQAMLKIWTETSNFSDKLIPSTRRIIFINSVAALCTAPGLSAYNASKGAVRSLADCLRMEAMVYSSPACTYAVHCAFPSTFISDSFFAEQECKPELTKQFEGTDGTREHQIKRHPTAKKVADTILAGIARGDYAICDDSLEGPFLFANMIGVSPKRGYGIVDTLLGFFMVLAWPAIMRPWWDGMCRKYSATYHKSKLN